MLGALPLRWRLSRGGPGCRKKWLRLHPRLAGILSALLRSGLERIPLVVRRRRNCVMIPKIFPRNLTARAATLVAGNPVTTRLESGVGNCFPGLEFDHRNLDRRFFPGLIINFGVLPPVLADVDPGDQALSALSPADVRDLSAAVRDAMADLRSGTWNLTSISQGGRTIDLATAP